MPKKKPAKKKSIPLDPEGLPEDFPLKSEPLSYEDKVKEIDRELSKRRSKWDQWDQRRALEPWVNRLISNQFKNILRNHYSNFVRPCLNCPFNNSHNSSPTKVGSLCGFTPSGLQCGECPLYAKWEKTKKAAYDIKMAVTLEAEKSEVLKLSADSFDIIRAEQRLHEEMEKHLPKKQFFIYNLLFIQHKDEEEVADILGYRSNEKGRKAGYKQIKNLRKKFKHQAILLLKKTDICL